MLESCKVALTGPLAAGKSTTLKLFKELGAFVVSADQIVHQLLSPYTDLGQRIVSLLGEEVIVSGEFDRALISKKIFSDSSKLENYEALLHPQVQKEIEKTFLTHTPMAPVFIAEIPLLYEAQLQDWYDAVIYVTAPKEKRKCRYSMMSPLGEMDFERREKRFLSEEEKMTQATFILDNSSSKEELQKHVNTIYEQLKILRKKS